MRKLLLPFLILCSLTSFSQKKDKRDGQYSAYLYSVDVPKELKKGSLDSLLSVYEDDIIKIDWDYAGSQIGFELKNKSSETLKIIWDDAAFISLANESGKIFHKGVKYIDRENSQPPTSVYKNTILSDLISPTAYTSYVSGQYGGWRSRPLIPIGGSVWSGKVEYKEELIGQTMRVILPLKIEDKLIEYAFSFRTQFIDKK